MTREDCLSRVFVYRKPRNGSEATVMASFLTYYRARKFVLRTLAAEPPARQYHWIIRSHPPDLAEPSAAGRRP